MQDPGAGGCRVCVAAAWRQFILLYSDMRSCRMGATSMGFLIFRPRPGGGPGTPGGPPGPTTNQSNKPRNLKPHDMLLNSGQHPRNPTDRLGTVSPSSSDIAERSYDIVGFRSQGGVPDGYLQGAQSKKRIFNLKNLPNPRCATRPRAHQGPWSSLGPAFPKTVTIHAMDGAGYRTNK